MYIYRADDVLSSTSAYYNNSSYDMAAAVSGTTQHHPYYSNFLGVDVAFHMNLALTQMPIPTQNTPFLLNFSGPAIDMQISWNTQKQNDVAFLIQNFPTANPSVDVVVDLTQEWGGLSTTVNTALSEKFNLGSVVGSSGTLRFSGVVSDFKISQKAGEILWSCTMSLMVGLVIG